VLLYFRIHDNSVIRGGYTMYYDKVPVSTPEFGESEFQAAGGAGRRAAGQRPPWSYIAPRRW